MDRRPTREELEQKIRELEQQLAAQAENFRESGARKKADEALKQSEEKIRAIFNATTDGILVADIRTKKFLTGNDAICKMLGYTPEEITKLEVSDIHPQESIAYVIDQFERQARKAIISAPDIPVKRRDGSIFFADINSAPATIGAREYNIGVFRDITARREIENALRESEKKYRELIELLPQGVFETDERGDIVYINRHGSDHYGYGREDIAAGLNALEVIVPGDRERAAKNIRRVLSGEQLSGNEYSVIKKDGGIVPVVIYSSPIINNDRVDGFRGVIVDLTDRKKREEDLIKIEKLESLGILAGGIAHDFNNLLTTIMGNISIALLHVKAEDPPYHNLRAAEKASCRARGLTQQLLTFSKGGAPIKKATDIFRIIKEADSFALLGSNVKSQYLVPPDLWPAEVDEGQLSQVFHNIFINALHAMPAGGLITVDGSNMEANGSDVALLPVGKYVKISISDQGAGISPEHIQKIFDPYFTTKQKGSGLGLASAFSIVRNHKGTITAESTLDKGSTFHIFLPALEGMENRGQAPDQDSISVAKKRILVMDDEEDVRRVVALMLQRIGCEVTLAADGQEAVDLYRQSMAAGSSFDGVILDITVPDGMGGREVIVRLLEINPAVKAVVSSGYSDAPIMANYKEYGFCGVMSKPYDIRKLRETLCDFFV